MVLMLAFTITKYDTAGMCIASSGKEEKSTENDDMKDSATGGGNMFAR